MKTTAPLILASGSPRRQQLVRDLGLPFEVLLRAVEEIIPEGAGPEEAATFLAKHKSEAYIDLAQDNIILTSDTIVSLHGKLLEKPRDEEEAYEMLAGLSGSSNDVITGVCIRHQHFVHTFHALTKVHFRYLSDQEIWYYIRNYRPFDKAGAYGIQEWIGMVGVERIEGDYYNVVGLPVGMVWEALNFLGLLKMD